MPTPDAARNMILRGNVDSLGIKYDQLPKMPFWAPLFLYFQRDWKLSIAAKVVANAQAVGRPLIQDEKDAIAEHWARYVSTQPYRAPITLAVGYGCYRRTASSFKFPLWTPNPAEFDINKFPFLGMVNGAKNPVEALAVRTMWTMLRFASWMFVSKLAVGTTFFIWTVRTYGTNLSQDPRLQQYLEDVKARRSSGPGRTAQSVSRPDRLEGHQDFPMEQQPAFSQQHPQTTEPTWTGAQRPQPQATQTSFDEDEFGRFIDDASPVAPEQRRPAQQQQGSAWDRLRSQARTGTTTSDQQGGSPTTAWGRRAEDEATSRGAKQGTSYNFSLGDEERAYAKDQAQREFDEMLERERRGETNARR